MLVEKEVGKTGSAYAPQVGGNREEKEMLWEEMAHVLQGGEKICLGGELN